MPPGGKQRMIVITSLAAKNNLQLTVWRQAIKAESGQAKGQETVTVLLDLVKYYGSIFLPILMQPGERLGCPMQILRLCINMHCGGRHIQMRSMVKRPLLCNQRDHCMMPIRHRFHQYIHHRTIGRPEAASNNTARTMHRRFGITVDRARKGGAG